MAPLQFSNLSTNVHKYTIPAQLQVKATAVSQPNSLPTLCVFPTTNVSLYDSSYLHVQSSLEQAPTLLWRSVVQSPLPNQDLLVVL